MPGDLMHRLGSIWIQGRGTEMMYGCIGGAKEKKNPPEEDIEVLALIFATVKKQKSEMINLGRGSIKIMWQEASETELGW